MFDGHTACNMAVESVQWSLSMFHAHGTLLAAIAHMLHPSVRSIAAEHVQGPISNHLRP